MLMLIMKLIENKNNLTLSDEKKGEKSSLNSPFKAIEEGKDFILISIHKDIISIRAKG